MSFTQVFGGGIIHPTDISYSSTALTASVTLRWPTEIGSEPLVCAIMDVAPSSSGLSIKLPSAKLVSVGESILFNNVGTFSFVVNAADGTQLISIPPSTAWNLYLTNSTTVGGTWNAFQLGAGVSAAVSGALAGAGLTATGSTLSQTIPVTTYSADYTTGPSDLSRALVWTGANGTLSVPAPSTVGSSWFVHAKNAGTGTLVVAPQAGTIDGLASISLSPSESFLLACDGTSFYTIGRSSTASTAFTFMVIPVPGAGVYTLNPTQYANSAIRCTGALTGNRQVVVPNVTGRYYIDNATTGAFTLTVKTAAGTGYTVTQGSRMIVYCDGTNVYDAVSLGTSGGVIPIVSGGTGATTASAALVNLGGTAIGTAIFTAPSQAVGRFALGVSPVGDALYTAIDAAAARTAVGATVVGSAVMVAATPQAARLAIGAASEDDAIMYALVFG